MGYQDAIRDSDVMDGLSIRFLKFFGMWDAINEYRATGKRTAVTTIHVLGTLVITIPYVVCQLQSFFNIEFDLQKQTYLYLHPLPAASLCCRILIFWFRMESVCRLYNLTRNDFFNFPNHIRADVKNIYENISRMSNMSCVFIFFWLGGLEMLYMLFPGTPVDYIQHHTGSMSAVKTGRKKILGGWYPVPMGESPYYEVIFAYEAVGLFWIATIMGVYFNVFFQLLICLYAHFVVFKFRLSSLTVDPVENISRKNNNHHKLKDIKIYEELREIFLQHQKLLKYTDELRSVYNPMVTITLGIGIIVLIIGAVQILLGKTSDTSFIFQLAQVFSFEFIEVCMFCLGSSLIETASTDLHFAIYCSDWYKAGVKFRRDAQMLMIRTRRGCTLTAIVMYPVNLETLGSILQFTYSTIALTMNSIA